MIHELKLTSQYYDDSASGAKTFEICKNDRDYKVGDFICLREWEHGKYTGRQHARVITYILDDTDYLRDGYVCLGVHWADEASIYYNLANKMSGELDKLKESEDKVKWNF